MKAKSNLGPETGECCVVVDCRGRQKMDEKVILCRQLVDWGRTKLSGYEETF